MVGGLHQQSLTSIIMLWEGQAIDSSVPVLEEDPSGFMFVVENSLENIRLFKETSSSPITGTTFQMFQVFHNGKGF